MSNDKTERHSEQIFDTWELDEWPIHFSGAALAVSNTSPTQAETVRLYDSDDGTTWNIMTFSLHNSSGNLAVTVQPLSKTMLLFMTARRYLRIAVAPDCPSNVRVELFQWMPRTRQLEEPYT